MSIRTVSIGDVSSRDSIKKLSLKFLRFLPCLFVVHALLGVSASIAQSSTPSASAVAPRITGPVDDSKVTRLPGNVPMLARRAQYDHGEAEASTQMTHIRLVLSRTPEQQAALTQYLADLQSKSSPNYHKWLTPEQFGKLYGPADSDIAAIVAWIESKGLKLEEVSTGRTNIAFSGTVGQVEAAFNTQIHSFEVNGQQFYSNIADPSIPSALAPVVMGVAHLDTIRPKSDRIPGPAGKIDSGTKRLVPISAAQARGPRPSLTLNEGSSSDPSYFLFIVPGDAATIYDTPNTTFNANYTSGTTYNGSGVSIGIGGDAPINTSTVANYRTVFLGNTTPPTLGLNDGSSSGDTDEAYIDLELSGGIAPGATIVYYGGSDLSTAINAAISANTVDIFSLSFSQCEVEFTTAENSLQSAQWQQAAGQGIAVVVSTGDNGSAECDVNDANGTTEATQGLSVNGLASTPYNIAVGGTDFAGLTGSFSTYASESQGSSATYFRTALSYIPESTWNDSTENDTTISANIPWTAISGDSADANIAAGGGGPSNCATNTTTDSTLGSCTAGYPKPSWQRGTGVPSDRVRDLPDVSLMSGNGFDPAAWLVCTDDTVTNTTYTQNCSTESDGDFYFNAFGGTSTAAPTFAGILALVQQKTGDRMGQAVQELYNLYNGSNASVIFHDVTTGNNSVACVSGSPSCAANSGGYYYETGYNTTAGYDLATGLGSVDVKNLVTYWGSSTGSGTATVNATPSSGTVTTAQSFTVAVSVTGSGTTGTPTGTVTLSGGGYTSSAETLSSGDYTFTIPAGALSVGTDTLTITYSGDTNYASTTGTTSVIVTAAPAPAVTLTPTSLTFASTNQGSSAPTQSVTVKNTGTAALTISGITITGTNASSYSETNTCGTGLAAGASCAITVTFTPAAAGVLTAAVSIADNVTGSPQTVPLTGTGVAIAPVVSLSPTSLTFASTTEGSSAATQSVMVKNTGTAALTISGITITGTGASSYSETNTCGTGLAIGASCAITVTFKPAAAGTLTAAVSIADNITGSPQTVSLTGIGVALAPVVSISPTSLTFPQTTLLTSAPTQMVTITNNGTAPLTITTIAISNGQNYTETSACGTVAIGASCISTVTFTPTTFGTLTGTLSITDNAPNSPQTVTLSGTVKEAGSYTLAAGAATVAPGSSATSTITATGVSGYDGSPITLSGCTQATAPSGATDTPTCSITAATITIASGSTTGTGTVSFSTTAASSSFRAGQTGNTAKLERWAGAGGVVLAGLFLFGIPARRRNWKSILGILIFMAGMGVLSGCGGGGGGGSSNPGTTAGTYTYTITGTDAAGDKQPATITLTVS